MTSPCDNCHSAFPDRASECPECGYPMKGTTTEQTKYRAKLMELRDCLEEAEKADRSMLSFFIVFLFAALVTLFFSLVFHRAFYHYVIIYTALAGAYYFFYYLTHRYGYYTLLGALCFYVLHTIFELQAGMVPQNFLEGRQAANGFLSFIFMIIKAIPYLYVLLRIVLVVVFIRGLYYHQRLRRHPRMAHFIRKQGLGQ